MVIKAKVSPESFFGFIEIGVVMEVDFLTFDASPEAFDKDVVKVAASPVHADRNGNIGQRANKFAAG